MNGIDACHAMRTAIEGLHEGLGALASIQRELDEALTLSTPAPALLESYTQHLERVAQADARRIEALNMLGLGTADMSTVIARCQDIELASLWDEVREQLPNVALHNRKHAQFLQRASAGIQAGLVLLGVMPNQPPLYGPSGQKQGASVQTRPLGSA
ncbi:MAG: flagellar export chaperone FlgN [Pseudomonadota bacterium]